MDSQTQLDNCINMFLQLFARSCCNPLLHFVCALQHPHPLQSSELQDPCSIAWRLIHPHPPRAIVHNRIREQPLLGSTVPCNALHPIIATTNHSDPVQEDSIDVWSGLGHWWGRLSRRRCLKKKSFWCACDHGKTMG